MRDSKQSHGYLTRRCTLITALVFLLFDNLTTVNGRQPPPTQLHGSPLATHDLHPRSAGDPTTSDLDPTAPYDLDPTAPYSRSSLEWSNGYSHNRAAVVGSDNAKDLVGSDNGKDLVGSDNGDDLVGPDASSRVQGDIQPIPREVFESHLVDRLTKDTSLEGGVVSDAGAKAVPQYYCRSYKNEDQDQQQSNKDGGSYENTQNKDGVRREMSRFKSPGNQGMPGGSSVLTGNPDHNGTGSKDIKSCPYCYTLWTADPKNKSRTTVQYQGCWRNGPECEQSRCHDNQPPRQNHTHFCCCVGNMCNTEYVDVYDAALHTTSVPGLAPAVIDHFHDTSYRRKTIMIALVSVGSVALTILVGYLVYRLCLTQKLSILTPVTPDDPDLDPNTGRGPDFNPQDLKLEDVLVSGRYSEVRKGHLGDKEVAVKIYQPHHRQYFYNERTAFSLPFMEHENVVKFWGSVDQEGLGSNLPQYLVVTQYMPHGSLNSYLKNSTLDWYTLCKMCCDITRGLAHLHTDITQAELFKPAIAHRDVNTRNILVKPDLTCVLADLGFSVGVMGSKVIKNGVEECAEQTSLADVGTLRYMAPEVFGGAVNLRDCEASLKQIDIYALGLVVWELASRCVDLYQGAPMPDYQLPFQIEAGPHPTFEKLQLLVDKQKTRPKFPDVWKDTNPAVRCLKETMEDCWDSDAEARLTALCVLERLTDMGSLWLQGSRQRAMQPNVNTTINLPDGNLGSLSSSSAVVANGVTYLPSFVEHNNERNEIEGLVGEEDRVTSPLLEVCINSRVPGYTTQIITGQRERGLTRVQEREKGQERGSNRRSFRECQAEKGKGGECASALLRSDSPSESSEGLVGGADATSWMRQQSLSELTCETTLPSTPAHLRDSLSEDLNSQMGENNSRIGEHNSSRIGQHNSRTGEHNSRRGGNPAGVGIVENYPLKDDNVMLAMNNAVIVHPNQGRNPTMERNTHKKSDEELTIDGNRLVGPSDRDTKGGEPQLLTGCHGNTSSSNRLRNVNSEGFDHYVDSTGSGQNDGLNMNMNIQRTVTSIPYLQNPMTRTSSQVNPSGEPTPNPVRPKLANVHSSGSSYLRLQPESNPTSPQWETNATLEQSQLSSVKHKLMKLIRPKDLGSKFSQLVFGRSKKKNNGVCHNQDYNPDALSDAEKTVQVELKGKINREPAQYVNSGMEVSPVNSTSLNQTSVNLATTSGDHGNASSTSGSYYGNQSLASNHNCDDSSPRMLQQRGPDVALQNPCRMVDGFVMSSAFTVNVPVYKPDQEANATQVYVPNSSADEPTYSGHRDVVSQSMLFSKASDDCPSFSNVSICNANNNASFVPFQNPACPSECKAYGGAVASNQTVNQPNPFVILIKKNVHASNLDSCKNPGCLSQIDEDLSQRSAITPNVNINPMSQNLPTPSLLDPNIVMSDNLDLSQQAKVKPVTVLDHLHSASKSNVFTTKQTAIPSCLPPVGLCSPTLVEGNNPNNNNNDNKYCFSPSCHPNSVVFIPKQYVEEQALSSQRSKENSDASAHLETSRPQWLSLKGHNYTQQSEPNTTKVVGPPLRITAIDLEDNWPTSMVAPNVTISNKSTEAFRPSVQTQRCNPKVMVSPSAKQTARPSAYTDRGSPSLSINHAPGLNSKNRTKKNISVGKCNNIATTPVLNKASSFKDRSSKTPSLRSKKNLAPESSEKIRKRVKTPVSFLKGKGRFSLYDDRLMTQSLDEMILANGSQEEGSANIMTQSLGPMSLTSANIIQPHSDNGGFVGHKDLITDFPIIEDSNKLADQSRFSQTYFNEKIRCFAPADIDFVV